VRRAIVTKELEGPLDRALRGLFQEEAERAPSWSVVRRWIRSGKVRVAGELVTEPTLRVVAGAELCFNEAAPKLGVRKKLARDAVVYVDTHVVVVDKPPDVSTVPYERSDVDTLDALVREWLERGGKSGQPGRPSLGVVHRLDKETSGLVVFARTWLAKEGLAAQFRKHTVHRRYLAIAHGELREPRSSFRSFLVQNRGDGLRGSARGKPPPSARCAVTHVERLELLHGATLLACRLETGRTHQIRIHLSEAGHPLLGERVYIRGWGGVPIRAPRLMLHAAELEFTHPATEKTLRFELEMPSDMRTVVRRLSRPGSPPSGA
jgi:23S rRNA pseudouridine1911/1915/1917 synthase